MTKKWFPQRNASDACVALIKTIIHTINFPISQTTIESDIRNHKEFPLLSFEAIIQVFKKWGIEAIAYEASDKLLIAIPSLSIFLIHEKEMVVEVGVFVMFYKLENEIIEYMHPRKGWVKENINEFNLKREKTILSLSQIVASGEPDFEEKERKYNEQKNGNPELKNIRVMNDFVTDEECEYIIKISEKLFNRSMLMGENNIIENSRTSCTAELHDYTEDKVLKEIRKRAATLINMPETHFEPFQCVSYEKGQEYKNHYDTFDENIERARAAMQAGGQRKYTLLVYLNDDFEGGETHFPNLDLLLIPKKKRVVIFNSLDHEGKVLKAALHAGLPVTQGRKYAINIWVRNKPLTN
jgi:prolyl 4-hydroxylase